MHKSFLTSLIIALVCGILSCKQGTDNPGPVSFQDPVYVVCEGSLGNGNSALTLYDRKTGVATENVFSSVNGTALGDVFQSMIRIGDRYFLCINNSDKIVVVNAATLRYEVTVPVPKPRYILPLSAGKAFVSSIFSNKLFVLNTQTLLITDTLLLPSKNPEGMLALGTSAYVCAWDTANAVLYGLNSATNKLEQQIPLAGPAPQEIVQDKEGMLWILSGNKANGKESKLTRVNPASGSILSSYSFGSADPLRLVLNGNKDSLYFIEVSYSGGNVNNGVYRMGIHDAALPTTAFVQAQGLQYFWGLGIHPESGDIYIADPVGFTQRGKVYIYKPDGTLESMFATGVGPGHFLFD